MRVEAMAFLRGIRTVDAITVQHARTRVGEVAMPDEIGALRQLNALDLAFAVRREQAQFNLFGVLRVEREIDLAHPTSRPGDRFAAPDRRHSLFSPCVASATTVRANPRPSAGRPDQMLCQCQHDTGEDDEKTLADDGSADIRLIEGDQHDEGDDCALRDLAEQRGILQSLVLASSMAHTAPKRAK